MANVCERCKRSMSSHDDHASCPQCRMAAGDCHLDGSEPLNCLWGTDVQAMGKASEVQTPEPEPERGPASEGDSTGLPSLD